MTQRTTDSIQLSISFGHLVLLWQTINSHFSEANRNLSEEEQRAIWGLEDLLEQKLTELGYGNLPQEEWLKAVAEAKVHMKDLPVEFR